MTWQIFIEHHQVPQGTGSEIRDQNQTTPHQTRPDRAETKPPMLLLMFIRPRKSAARK